MKNYTHEFKSFIREPFAFPGGYSLVMICRDGGALCHKCAKDNARLIISATRQENDDQWQFQGAYINWEDNSLHCDHCGEQIKPEYGDE